MAFDPLTVSLDTLIAVAPMLGYPLEDRARVREAQDDALANLFQKGSTRSLRHPSQATLFLIAPLDILVVREEGKRLFRIIEVNGTGIGGLTNMPLGVIATVLAGLSETGKTLVEPHPLVLVAASGVESSKNPRRNHLVHEKILYAEALKRGLMEQHGPTAVKTMAWLLENKDAMPLDRPLVVVGYIKEFLNQLEVSAEGRLTLFNRPVTAAVNDRFCLNVLSRFGGRVDLSRWATLNRSFVAGADKGVAYELFNEFAKTKHCSYCPGEVEFSRAMCRTELILGVTDWLRRGRAVVIKPQGTGLGHGLEFFLDPNEPVDALVAKIDHSIRVTEHYYGAVGGAFPYTLCEFADTDTVQHPGHPLHGHKFEVRIVVYRENNSLKAFPSIAKVSSQGYDADKPSKLSLINNITTSAEAKRREGTDFMLPLCNRENLDLLGIGTELLEELCAYCTGYIRYILDQVQDQPARLGLPEREAHAGISNGQRYRGD